MADFDPYADAPAPEPVMATKDEPAEAPQPKKGNKLTRNTHHWVALIVDIVLTIYPLIYGIVGFFVNISFVITYICYSVGIAVNFYNTKNFAGRYLGRLRWHTYVVEGKTYYYFESMPKDDQGKVDNAVFWICLWFPAVYYVVLTIAYIFTVQVVNLPITIVGAIASIVNLSAYIRCSSDAKRKMKAMAAQVGRKALESQMQQ